MTFNEAISFFKQLLDAIWPAFQFSIFGLPVWGWLACFMTLGLVVAFVRYVFFAFIDDTDSVIQKGNNR